MDKFGGIKSSPQSLQFSSWSPALDRIRQDSGASPIDLVNVRFGQVAPRNPPPPLRDQAFQTAARVAGSLLPPWLQLPSGQEVDLSAHPRLARRTDDAPLQKVLAGQPQALAVLDEVAGALQDLYPGDTGTQGLKHFASWSPGPDETLEQFAQTYTATVKAAARLGLDNQYAVNRMLDHVRYNFPPDERAPLIELVGQTGSLEKGTELWNKLKRNPDPGARQKLDLLLQAAPTEQLGCSAALQALDLKGGLDFTLQLLAGPARFQFQRIQSALHTAVKLGLDSGDTDGLSWLAHIVGWKEGLTHSESLVRSVLSQPQPQRAAAAERLERLLRERRNEPNTVGEAIADFSALQALPQSPGLDDNFSAFRGLFGRDSKDNKARAAFTGAGLDSPDRFERLLALTAPGPQDKGLHLYAALKVLALESQESPAYGLEERRELVDLLRQTQAFHLGDFEKDYALVASDRKPDQSLSQRVELLRSATGKPGAFQLLDEVWPNHQEVLETLALASAPEVRLIQETRYPDEALADAAHRFCELKVTLGQRLDQSILHDTHRWFSSLPPEDFSPLSQALADRLSPSARKGVADLRLAVEHRRPDEPIAQLMERFNEAAAQIEPSRLREALAWLKDNPACSASHLTAQALLLGSLDRAMESLARPAGGIREDGASVSFGGVRIKRRS